MIFSSNFLPCLAYFIANLENQEIKITINEQYQKQSYFNRLYILGPNKVETLVVPVQKAQNNSLIKEIKIDYSEKWYRKNWKSIETAYKNTPYFEFYDYLFAPLFTEKHKFLLDLNLEAMSICLKALKSCQSICHVENEYFEISNQLISFNAKKRANEGDINKSVSYNQNFGNVFEPNLSIIDLIFNKGPESLDVLRKYID